MQRINYLCELAVVQSETVSKAKLETQGVINTLLKSGYESPVTVDSRELVVDGGE